MVHLDGVSRPRALAYLGAIPIPNTPNSMSSRLFTVALKHTLGLPQFPGPKTDPSAPSELIPLHCPLPRCNAVLDVKGTHALSCKAKGDSISRHNHICFPILDKARAANLSARSEVRHMVPDSERRPGDIVISEFENNRDLVLDVTVVNSQCVSYRKSAPEDANFAVYAIERAEKRKDKDTLKFCSDRGMCFLPLVVESYGGWSEGAHAFFEELIHRYAQATGREFARELAFFYQILSLSLQRSNARMILERLDRMREESNDTNDFMSVCF
jgi:hypothetical protein